MKPSRVLVVQDTRKMSNQYNLFYLYNIFKLSLHYKEASFSGYIVNTFHLFFFTVYCGAQKCALFVFSFVLLLMRCLERQLFFLKIISYGFKYHSKGSIYYSTT